MALSAEARWAIVARDAADLAAREADLPGAEDMTLEQKPPGYVIETAHGPLVVNGGQQIEHMLWPPHAPTRAEIHAMLAEADAAVLAARAAR